MFWLPDGQTVLTVPVSLEKGEESVWRDPRAYPVYVGLASLAVFVFKLVSSTKTGRKLRTRNTEYGLEEEDCQDSITSGWHSCSIKAGSITILIFKAARLSAIWALMFLVMRTSFRHELTVLDMAMVAGVIYASILAVLNIVAPAKQALGVSFHLTVVTLAISAPYAYRDVWPLMKFKSRPADEGEGVTLWVQVALAIFASVVEPLFEPYPYIAVDPQDLSSTSSPEQTASLISTLFFIFLDPTVWLANRAPHLTSEQLPPLCDYDAAKNLKRQSYPYLDPFTGATRGNLAWKLIYVFRHSLSIQATAIIILLVTRIAVPVAINGLLSYLEQGENGSVVKPWVWIILMTGGSVISGTFANYYFSLSTGVLTRVQSIITSLVFDHALRIRLKAETSSQDVVQAPQDIPSGEQAKKGSPGGSNAPKNRQEESAAASAAGPSNFGNSQTTKVKVDPKAQSNNLVGKMNNLVTSDLTNIIEGRDFLIPVVSAPVSFVLTLWFLYSILGWSSFVGLAVMIALFPVPTLVSSSLGKIQKQKMRMTDARVQTVTETMSVLRMIKMFGWEARVRADVAKKREDELQYIWKSKVLSLFMRVGNYTIPLVHMVVTYGTFTLVMKRPLSASIVFSSISAFELFRSQMWQVFSLIPIMIKAIVSLGRIADFLRNTELLDRFDEKSAASDSLSHEDDIGMKNAHFTWASELTDGSMTPSKQTFRLRVEGELIFKKGAFNLIIGPTGSGKTSLLMALLGEMHYVPLGPDSWVSLPRNGGIAYAVQESWVQNETIKNNILFGSPYDEDRYKKVIYQCGLKRDLSLLDAGDATEVGEKGLTLSGGQKARITLARAIYSSADILLLDDVLAALDVHTARWVVDKCFKGDLIRGRTVLLVTHNVALASPIADFVISLGTNGEIATRGTVSDALKENPELAQEVKKEEEAISDDKQEEEDEIEVEEHKGKLIVAEEIKIGHVSRSAFGLFFGALGGKWSGLFWIQFALGAGGPNVLDSLAIWWLGYWARQYATHPYEDVSVLYYLGVYSLIFLGVMLLNAYGTVIYAFATMRASRLIHDSLMVSIVGTTFRWLDITPTSRVIARCTQDIGTVDGTLADTLKLLIEQALLIPIRLGIILLFAPIFVFPSIAVTGLCIWLGQIYMKAQLPVKRESSAAQAPILGVFGGAITSLPSIRAYGAERQFQAELSDRLDKWVRATKTFWNLNRWIGVRIEMASTLFTCGLAFYLVYGQAAPSPSVVGFVLNMATSFCYVLLLVVRFWNSFEVSGNSLERIKQYITIEQEPEPSDNGVPPAHWPSSGELTIEKLSARYSPDGPQVLQDVSFHINAGERVGIVGRTGSGKSTLTLALLRCIYTEGKIYYDGLPTDSVNLDSLRSNITIIPQVPELLSGSLRRNLDTFEQYDDAVLNDALRAAGLSSLQQQSDDNRLTLDSQISSGGANLSVGQRQIIALARAIVRQSKLLVLDEATSAIDYETDAIIQSSLRNELKSDVTVLTVAHRLQTIMDYDKIVVLDAGKLVEFDTPKVLLQQQDSLLRALVDESADKDTLYAMAKLDTM